jgi:PncC family amidohydrolase
VPAKPPAYTDLADRMRALHATLRRKKLTIAVAESCTGGLLGAILSEHSGSSDYFRGGMEVYSDEAKSVLADVPPQLIHSHGAVSSVVAGALARGARARLGAKIGLGITGIAGPTGATPGKPVGLVYIAIDAPKVQRVQKKLWTFDRAGNRLASVGVALDLLAEAIE